MSKIQERKLTLWMPNNLVDAIDRWRAAQMPIPSRSEAVRVLVDSGIDPEAENQKLRALVARLTAVAKDLAANSTDPGSEAMAAIYCGEHLVFG